MSRKPSIAIVHEWLASYAGSERVVEQMLQVFPQADLFALVDFLPERDRGMLGDRAVRTSFIQRLPFARRYFRAYLPLMPLAVEQWDFSSYDIVLSSSHAVAKGVLTRADQLHISYIHTPIRYAWDLQHEYLRQAGLTRGLKSLLVRPILHYLRLWDRAAADRVDVMIANSRYVARRIQKTYRRQAEVIYPPVDTDRFLPVHPKEDYYVAASRMVPYKRMDLIVNAFREMPGRQLVVIGDGPDFKKVSKLATPNIKIVGYQEGPSLRGYLQRAKALVFAADEDFGILPVEAQACGTPVIALGRGGALETIVDGETGILFADQSVEAILAAVERFESRPLALDANGIRERALRFSAGRFRRELDDFVHREWDCFQSERNVECEASIGGRSD